MEKNNQLNNKGNPPTLVGGGEWGRIPRTIFSPPTLLVVELRHDQALSAEFVYSIRDQVSFRVLPEEPLWSDGRESEEAVAGDNQRGVRYAGDRDREGAGNGRSCACVFIGATTMEGEARRDGSAGIELFMAEGMNESQEVLVLRTL